MHLFLQYEAGNAALSGLRRYAVCCIQWAPSLHMKDAVRGASGHIAFQSPKKYPEGLTKQLDHIIVNRRFFSSIRKQKVCIPPIPTRHCVLSSNFNFRWKKQEKKLQPPFWSALRDDHIKSNFATGVKKALKHSPKRIRSTNETETATTPHLEVENSKVSWEKLAEAIHSTSNTLPKRLQKGSRFFGEDQFLEHVNVLPGDMRCYFLSR